MLQNKVIILFISLSLVFINVQGQITGEEKNDTLKHEKKEIKQKGKWDKFVFGGNIWVQVGTMTLIDVSPVLGYYFTDKLIGGIGGTYQYYNEKWYSNRIQSNLFGIRAFSEYTLLDHIGNNLKLKANFAMFAHVEYEALNLDRDFSISNSAKNTSRYWINGYFVGGGVKQHFGKHSSFNIAILYNLNHDMRSPYTNPLIRIGFYF